MPQKNEMATKKTRQKNEKIEENRRLQCAKLKYLKFFLKKT